MFNLNHERARIRCIDCRYHHPRFCGYTKLRDEGGNTMPEDGPHCCRDFSPGRPPDRDDAETETRAPNA